MMDAKLAALGLGWITSTIGIVFWVLVIGLLFVIVRFIRRKDYLLASVTCVPLAALFVLPVMSYMEQREYLAKYEPAKAIFDKLCKEQSAPIIKRTVEDVEGVLLLKVRPSVNGQFDRFLADQMWAGAALPMERKADSGYAEYFLFDRRWVEWGSRSPGRQWRVVPEIGKAGQRGFQFVDLLQSDGKTRLRVTARSDAKAQEEPVSGIAYTRTPAVTPPPRYAVSYEDNVDLELRRHWIAGTTVLVIDTNTNEVIGQQSFWNWDQGFGARTGGRSPWGAARAQCPLDGNGDKQTHLFVDKVLKPIKGD